jgi:ABC-type nickel/cobalt efflux system permease component RcnA
MALLLRHDLQRSPVRKVNTREGCHYWVHACTRLNEQARHQQHPRLQYSAEKRAPAQQSQPDEPNHNAAESMVKTAHRTLCGEEAKNDAALAAAVVVVVVVVGTVPPATLVVVLVVLVLVVLVLGW